VAGRKPKLTKELIELLGTALQNGNYIETACDFAGINRATLYRWLQESEEDDAKPLLKELSDTVRKARAQAEMRHVLRIQKAAEGTTDKDGNYLINPNWSASAWWLERSHPKKWSKQTNVELSGVDGSPINVALDTRAALLELLTPKPDLED
jgi:transposase-like protein